MRIGILIDPIYKPAELINIAKSVEEFGYDSFWYPDEKFFRDCYIGLTLVASNTRRIQIGVCVTDPYSRHPIMTAAAIGSIAEIAPDRTWLGFGAGGRGFNAMGIKRDRPALAIREAVTIIRKLLAGESVDYHGKVLELNDRRLDFRPSNDIPIMVATGYGHLIQELAGEIADAAMLANYSSPSSIELALKRVYKGVQKSGRSISDLRLISRIDVAVNTDRQVARSAVAPAILSAFRASYPSLPYLDDLPEFDLSSRFLDVIRRKDYQTRAFYASPSNSAPLIPEVLTDHLAITGTLDEVGERVAALAELKVFSELTIRPVISGNQTFMECLSTLQPLLTPYMNQSR
jgi:5,10-methylenetetrahydromethanopterin reductase